MARFYDLVQSTTRQCGLTVRNGDLTQAKPRSYDLLLAVTYCDSAWLARRYGNLARPWLTPRFFNLAQTMVRQHSLMPLTAGQCGSAVRFLQPHAVNGEAERLRGEVLQPRADDGEAA